VDVDQTGQHKLSGDIYNLGRLPVIETIVAPDLGNPSAFNDDRGISLWLTTASVDEGAARQDEVLIIA